MESVTAQPIETPYGMRYVGVIGWRFNTIHPDGSIAGIPVGDAYTPPSTCTKDPEHTRPVATCTCGHRIVTNLPSVVTYIQGGDSYLALIGIRGALVWGNYAQGAWTGEIDSLNDPQHHILLRVAGTDPNEKPQPKIHADPTHTYRVSQLIALHGYLAAQDAHLAPHVRAQYPFPITVLAGNDYTEAADH